MAIRFSLCSSLTLPLISQKHDSNRGPQRSRVVMCAKNGISDNHQIKLSDDHQKIKVFEDRSAGIICYKDENGEITCEGYDEGPRFHHQISRWSFNSRDVEKIDMLQRCWLHVSDENEFEIAEKNV